MKVIGVDNFNRDTVDDVLVAEGLSDWDARQMASRMNEETPVDAPRYYVTRGEDYVLKVWEP